jgi:hypothetical protein
MIGRAIWGTAVALYLAPAAAQTPVEQLPGLTYESLAELPDWSGWWVPNADRNGNEEFAFQPPPFKPEARRAREAGRAADAPDPLRHCRGWQFTGSSGGFTEALEILFTPGRVTVTNERGLIRRIYSDGRAMPEALEYTNTGTSIGRWDGEALVIDTMGIDPRALYPGPGPAAIPFGENVVIRERIYLEDEDSLRFDVEIVAPDIFTEPYGWSRSYRRLSKTMANEISWCSEFDRSIEPGTGEQRFDMTPPPGLPPPPSR